MTDTPQVLLAHHLKALKLPTNLREYDKLARQCASDAVDHVRYLLRLAELELIERERRMVERRIKEASFPAVQSLDSFDFLALPSLNKVLVLELARSEYVLRLQRQLAGYKLLVIDELGYVPLSQTGAELLFEVFSQRYERGATIVTSNLPFDEWTGVFASERLTGAQLDRPADASCSHPGNERRQLPAQAEQAAPAQHPHRRDPGHAIRGIMLTRALCRGFRNVTLQRGNHATQIDRREANDCRTTPSPPPRSTRRQSAGAPSAPRRRPPQPGPALA